MEEKINNNLRKLNQRIKNLYHKYGNKKNITILIVVMLVFVVFVGYYFGMISSNKDTVLNGFENAVNLKDKEKILKYLEIDSKKVKLDTKTIEPFINYINENPISIKSKINNMRHNTLNDKKSFIRLEKRKRFIGSEYKIVILPVYVQIITNLKDMDIYINNKLSYKSEEDSFKKNIGPLVPGVYNIEGRIKTLYGEIKDDMKVTLLQEKNTVNFQTKVNMISVDSNDKEAQVYMNGEDTGKTVKEFKNVGPINMNGSVKIYIEKEYPWGKVKSDEIEIKDSSNIKLNINPVNNKLKEELRETLKGFYESSYDAIEQKNKSIIKNGSNKAKEQIFKLYGEKKGFLDKEYLLQNINIDDSVIEVKTNELGYNVKIINSIDYNKSQKFFGIPFKKTKNKDKFINELMFINDENKWQVVSINNMSTEDK